ALAQGAAVADGVACRARDRLARRRVHGGVAELARRAGRVDRLPGPVLRASLDLIVRAAAHRSGGAHRRGAGPAAARLALLAVLLHEAEAVRLTSLDGRRGNADGSVRCADVRSTGLLHRIAVVVRRAGHGRIDFGALEAARSDLVALAGGRVG